VRGGEVTLAAYTDGWLASRLVKGRALSDATRYGYRRLFERNIAPALGSEPLRRLTPERVRTWHADVVAAAGADQAAKSYRVLRAVLNTAVDDDLISRNPCRIKGAGIDRTPERAMPDTGEVLALIEAMEPRYRIVLVLAGLGGLRTGEMLGLRVADVDPLRQLVRVRQVAMEIPGLGRVVKDPKTDAGRRDVVLPRRAMDALAAHLATYPSGPDGEVVTGPERGPARRASLSAAWRSAKAAVGVDPGLHIHDLRHHAATLTARTPGVTTKELMSRIGHSSPRAALIYQHATEERDRNIADFIDEQLDSAERSEPGRNVIPFPKR